MSKYTFDDIWNAKKPKKPDGYISGVSGIYDPKHDPSTWWCPTCNEWVCNSDVTFEETHDPRYGGCGGDVE